MVTGLEEGPVMLVMTVAPSVWEAHCEMTSSRVSMSGVTLCPMFSLKKAQAGNGLKVSKCLRMLWLVAFT